MAKSRLLLVLRRAPYDSGRSKAALDLAMAFSVFDLPVDLLFLGDGVWQLLGGQDTAATVTKNVQKTLSSLPLYDIEVLYAEAEALTDRGIAAADIPHAVNTLKRSDLNAFFADFQQVLVF